LEDNFDYRNTCVRFESTKVCHPSQENKIKSNVAVCITRFIKVKIALICKVASR